MRLVLLVIAPPPCFLHKHVFVTKSKMFHFGYVEALPAQDRCVQLAIEDNLDQKFHRMTGDDSASQQRAEQVRAGAGSELTDSLDPLDDPEGNITDWSGEP